MQRIVETGVPAGIYMVGVSATAEHDTQDEDGFMQFTINGTDWEEGRQAWAWQNQRTFMKYDFPWTFAGGDMNLAAQFRDNNASTGTTICHFLNIWIQRVG